MSRLLILGATGFVGGAVLALALDDPHIATVVAPTRRPIPSHPRLVNPVIDFDSLDPEAPWLRVDMVVSALGTTLKATPAPDAYVRVETVYSVQVGKLALAQGAQVLVYVSSTGASHSARSFYLKTKATAEQKLKELGFPSLTLIRPAGIAGPRVPRRPAERMILGLLKLMGPVLPRRWRVVSGNQVARALLEAAIAASPGTHVVESEALW